MKLIVCFMRMCMMCMWVAVQRALDEEVRLLRSGFTDKYLKDLKEKERQMELLLRKAEELAAYPPPSRSFKCILSMYEFICFMYACMYVCLYESQWWGCVALVG